MSALMALVLSASYPGMGMLDLLVGHCWRGDLPKPGQQDTHCFTRLEDGRIKDVHTVTAGGKPVFSGQAVFTWDSAVSVVRYVYTEDGGGMMTGAAVPEPGGKLDFPDGVYVGSDGRRIAVKAMWARDADGWTLVESSVDMPALDRATRYARID